MEILIVVSAADVAEPRGEFSSEMGLGTGCNREGTGFATDALVDRTTAPRTWPSMCVRIAGATDVGVDVTAPSVQPVATYMDVAVT